MVVRKILETTLSAGSTSVSFTDTDIPNSLIRVYTSNADIIPVSRTLSGNTLTVTFEAQLNNIGVALEIVKAGLDIVDDLTSDSSTAALSAKQGKVLNNSVETLTTDLSILAEAVNNLDIPDNITDLNDVSISDIQTNQVLVWNGMEFINADQSAGSSIIYSTNERVIGEWIDGKPLYQKTVDCGVLSANTNKTVLYSDIGINNINTVAYFDVIINNTVNSNFNRPDNVNAEFYTQLISTGIFLRAYNTAITTAYATLRYTKTTD